MKLRVSTDNRAGSVTAKAGKADARDANYNVDPGSGRYKKITRTLSETDGSSGAGQISVTLETSSEFVGFVKDSYECDSLAFTSKGTIKLPSDQASQALGVVQDSIAMGFRVERACRLHLTASVVSDMDVAEVKLMGPAFGDKPVRVYDDFDDTVEITKPGDYELRGAYQLSVRLPNPGLGGRPISVEMKATLKPAD
jgi:hypothetical protein